MHVDAYLERIGVKGPLAPDLASLRVLHRAHLMTIPYENLDVQLGRRVTLDRSNIFRKIVERRRGGWCYEMNGLFGWALEQLGFRVTRVAGAVMREAFGDASVGNHLVLKVELDEGLYLADVGFGDGSIDPIRIAPGEFTAQGFAFALSRAGDGWWRLRNHPKGGARSFDFTLNPADEALFAERCDWLQTSELSPFVQNVACQRYTPQGLSVLRGRVLRRISGETVTETLLNNAGEFMSILDREFSLDVPEAVSLWPKIRDRHAALFPENDDRGE